MDSAQIIESFNLLFVEFLNKLCDIFPEKTEIKEYVLKYKMLSTVKEDYFILWYKSYTGPYGKHIMEDNIEYFMINYDTEKIKETVQNDSNVKEGDKDITLAHILKCKEEWESGIISDSTKSAICEYIKALYLLSINYN